MIKKSIFEDELVQNMHNELVKKAHNIETDNLDKAVDYLNSAADIFDSVGLTKNADQVLSVLTKIAKSGKKKPKDPKKISDRHTKGLTPEKMVKNLKNHGHPMNLADDHILNQEINDNLSVSDGELTVNDFEDEID